MVLGDIKGAGADLVYGRINWVGSVWGRIGRPQVCLVLHLPEGLNLIVLGTQGRVSDGDHVEPYLPAILIDPEALANQEMTRLLANGVASFALFIGVNCDNFERFCSCLIGHSTIF
ncbi:MAG: hypothetical protein ACLPXB_09820 [Thiobacillaceae bacterium]